MNTRCLFKHAYPALRTDEVGSSLLPNDLTDEGFNAYWLLHMLVTNHFEIASIPIAPLCIFSNKFVNDISELVVMFLATHILVIPLNNAFKVSKIFELIHWSFSVAGFGILWR